jgi:hypothetical protein
MPEVYEGISSARNIAACEVRGVRPIPIDDRSSSEFRYPGTQCSDTLTVAFDFPFLLCQSGDG